MASYLSYQLTFLQARALQWPTAPFALPSPRVATQTTRSAQWKFIVVMGRFQSRSRRLYYLWLHTHVQDDIPTK